MKKCYTLVHVLNMSICSINNSCHILNNKHCVYVSVKGSSEYLLDPLYALFSNILKYQVIFRITNKMEVPVNL